MNSRPTNTQGTGTPIALLVLALVLFVARFGYGYGFSDQDELLPLLLHLEDESLFSRDWFVGTQTAHLSVRSYFVRLLLPISRLIPLPIAVLIFFIALWLIIAWQAREFAHKLTGDQTAAGLAVVAALVIAYKWTPGGNDLVYAMLVPEMAAWALALTAINRFLAGKTNLPAMLLGIAAWFQLLVGILPGMVLGILLLWDGESRRNMRWLGFGLVFFVSALPIILPIAHQQFAGSSADASEIFYILAAFRNPHHHLPFSFPIEIWLKFLVVAIAGFAGYVVMHRRNVLPGSVFAVRFSVVTLLMLGAGTVFTEAWPVLLVTKLQFFKLTALLKFMAVSFAVAGLLQVSPRSMRHRLIAWSDSRWLIRTILAVCVFVMALTTLLNGPFSVWPERTHDPAFDDIGRWARSQTATDALFAVPPSASWFRTSTHRAIVINYNAFPFRDQDMIAWFDRLSAVAPIGHPKRGTGIQPALEAAYHGHSDVAWREIVRRFNVDYILVRGESRPPYAPVFSSGSWNVFACSNPDE